MRKIARPQGLFSMKDVDFDVQMIDCRDIVFKGWESSKMRAQGQGANWSLFTMPRPSPGITHHSCKRKKKNRTIERKNREKDINLNENTLDLNQNAKADEKSETKNINNQNTEKTENENKMNDIKENGKNLLDLETKIEQLQFSDTPNDDQKSRNNNGYSNSRFNYNLNYPINQPIPISYGKPYQPAIVKRTSDIDNGNIDKSSFYESVLMSDPFSNLYNNNRFSYSTPRSSPGELILLPNKKRRPQTARSFASSIGKNDSPKLSENLSSSKKSVNPQKNNEITNDEEPTVHNVLLTNDQLSCPKKRVVAFKGDNPNHFPFRISVSVLNEYAHKKQNNIKIKKQVSRSSMDSALKTKGLHTTARSEQ